MFEPIPDALCLLCSKQFEKCDRENCKERIWAAEKLKQIINDRGKIVCFLGEL